MHLGEAGQRFPLLLNVLYVAKQNYGFELVKMKVWGTQGHDEITQAKGRRVGTNAG